MHTNKAANCTQKFSNVTIAVVPLIRFFRIFLILPVFFNMFISGTLYAQNPDSLLYRGNSDKIMKQGLFDAASSSAIETAKELAEAGLFKEAAELLDDLVLSTANSYAASSKDLKKIGWKIDVNFDYNNTNSVNEKELTQAQKDSLNLLKRTSLYTGVSADLRVQKWGITNIKPILYMSNMYLSSRLQINAAYFNRHLNVENVTGYEKKLADFYPVKDTSGIDTGTTADTAITTHQEYKWHGFEKDSSDVFANKFTVTYTNNAGNLNPLFSFPVIWTFTKFRIDKPILASRSNIAINPYFEYRLRSEKLMFSGNWYCELMNYFGEGRFRNQDNSSLNKADLFDRLYNNPQITLSCYLKKLNVEWSESILSEFYYRREGLFKNLKDELNTISDNFVDNINTGDSTFYKDTILVKKYEETENSLWWDSKIRSTFRLFPWFYPKLKLSFLYAGEVERTTIYSVDISKFIAGDSTLTLKGIDFTVEPQFEFRLFNNSFRINCNYTFEYREAPIHDSIFSDCKFRWKIFVPTAYYTSRYLWETYKAHEPSIKFSFLYEKLQIKVSEAFRYENVADNKAFEICDNWSLRTRWDLFFILTPSISFSCIGDIELINNKLSTLLNDDVNLLKNTSNISISANTVFRF